MKIRYLSSSKNNNADNTRNSSITQKSFNLIEYLEDYQLYLDFSINKNIKLLTRELITKFSCNKILTAINIQYGMSISTPLDSWKLMALFNALQDNDHISTLSLWGQEFDIETANALYNLLKINTFIKELWIFNDFNVVDQNILGFIAQAIKEAKAIRSFAFCGNISTTVATVMLEAVKNNDSVITLRIDNLISDNQSIINLVNFIGSNQQIIILSTYNSNAITNVLDIQPLITALEKNNNLSTFERGSDKIIVGYDIMDSFKNMLATNYTLTYLPHFTTLPDKDDQELQELLDYNREYVDQQVALLKTINFNLDIAPTSAHREALRIYNKIGKSRLIQELQSGNINIFDQQQEQEAKYSLSRIKTYLTETWLELRGICKITGIDSINHTIWSKIAPYCIAEEQKFYESRVKKNCQEVIMIVDMTQINIYSLD